VFGRPERLAFLVTAALTRSAYPEDQAIRFQKSLRKSMDRRLRPSSQAPIRGLPCPLSFLRCDTLSQDVRNECRDGVWRVNRRKRFPRLFALKGGTSQIIHFNPATCFPVESLEAKPRREEEACNAEPTAALHWLASYPFTRGGRD